MSLGAHHYILRQEIQLMARIGAVQDPWKEITNESAAFFDVASSIRDDYRKSYRCVQKENLEVNEPCFTIG